MKNETETEAELLLRLADKLKAKEDALQIGLTLLDEGKVLVNTLQQEITRLKQELEAKHQHSLNLEAKITRLTHDNYTLDNERQKAIKETEFKNDLWAEEKVLHIEKIGQRDKLLTAIGYFLNNVIDNNEIKSIDDFECPFVLMLAVRYQEHRDLYYTAEEDE